MTDDIRRQGGVEHVIITYTFKLRSTTEPISLPSTIIDELNTSDHR